MESVLVFALVVAICLLAPLLGVDSRVWDERDRRGWWPGSRERE